eukprot:Rmarinus@m.27682
MYVYVLVMQQRALLALSLTHTTPPGGRMCVSHYTVCMLASCGISTPGFSPPHYPPYAPGVLRRRLCGINRLYHPLCVARFLHVCVNTHNSHAQAHNTHTHLYTRYDF